MRRAECKGSYFELIFSDKNKCQNVLRVECSTLMKHGPPLLPKSPSLYNHSTIKQISPLSPGDSSARRIKRAFARELLEQRNIKVARGTGIDACGFGDL